LIGPDGRVALYYAPLPDDPLWTAACAWLGRDPQSGKTLAQPDLPDITAITEDARRYGFHATLKPPMRLRPGRSWEELAAEAASLAATIAPFELPPLAVAELDGFLALSETAPCPELRALADTFVAGLDPFRAPPDSAELARRRGRGLSPQREALLRRWGYPDVFDSWMFHMTLTRRLTPAEHALYRPAAEAHLAEALRTKRLVADVCLFVQQHASEPFDIALRLRLGGG